MSHANVNLQDSFLNQVRRENVDVEVMLLNGTVFRGAVRGFDNFTVIMHVDGKQHLIYKHSIAQLIAPKLARSPHADARAGRPEKAPPAVKAQGERKQTARRQEKFNSLDLSGVKLDRHRPEETAERKDARGKGGDAQTDAGVDVAAEAESQEKPTDISPSEPDPATADKADSNEKPTDISPSEPDSATTDKADSNEKPTDISPSQPDSATTE
ncbi:MAG TPA: RNA chaperone Hfq [Sumerlaeia bacterium]|nr:RNA chaperone Hfq [Sumerlaeia bacterium]